jgi:hypothetical protein
VTGANLRKMLANDMAVEKYNISRFIKQPEQVE